jgi:NarL family two-component system response regulator LiaR
MTVPIHVLIADDHEIVRKGLHALIDTKVGFEVVGEARDGEEAVRKALSLKPDVILLDLEMPRKNGVEAIREIRKENPDARILVLTSFSDDTRVFSAVKGGALGYLLKDSSPQELLCAIEAVFRGRPSLDPNIAMLLIRELGQASELPPTQDPLTPRETQVLKLLAQGLSNRDIAGQLTVSERTVGVHVSGILSKLHLANRTQAALYALREGLASLDEQGT